MTLPSEKLNYIKSACMQANVELADAIWQLTGPNHEVHLPRIVNELTEVRRLMDQALKRLA